MKNPVGVRDKSSIISSFIPIRMQNLVGGLDVDRREKELIDDFFWTQIFERKSLIQINQSKIFDLKLN
jgi:hypothetical protein